MADPQHYSRTMAMLAASQPEAGALSPEGAALEQDRPAMVARMESAAGIPATPQKQPPMSSSQAQAAAAGFPAGWFADASPPASPTDSPEKDALTAAADLHKTLRLMSVQELVAYCEEEHGISEEVIDRAMDEPDIKAALLGLIAHPEPPPKGDGPLAKLRRPDRTGTRVDTWGKLSICKAAAAIDNDPDAQYWLGRRYNDSGNPDDGRRWLRKAASQGYYPAQCYLGKVANTQLVAHKQVATAPLYSKRPQRK